MSPENIKPQLALLLSLPVILCGSFLATDRMDLSLAVLFFYAWALFAIKSINAAAVLILALVPLERNNPLVSLDQLVLIKCALVMVLLAAWLLRRPGRAFPGDAFNVFWLFFLGLAALSTIVSLDPVLSLRYLLLVVTVAVLFYVWRDVLDTMAMIRFSLWVLVVTSAVVACVAVLQYLIIRFHIFRGLEPLLVPQRLQFQNILSSLTEIVKYRTYGTFSHPNLLGIYLALALPVIYVFVLLQEKWQLRLIAGCSFVLSMAALFLANSRGAIAATFVALVYISFHVFTRQRRLWACILAAVVVLLAGSMTQGGMSTAVRDYFRFTDKLSHRDVLWMKAGHIIAANPLLGTGPATFSKAYHLYSGMPAADSPEFLVEDIYESQRAGKAVHQPLLSAHNVWLQYLATMGVFAPAAVALFYFIFFREVRAVFLPRPKDKFLFYLVLGASGAILGTLVNGLFEAGVFLDLQFQSYLFIYLVALTLVCLRKVLLQRASAETGVGHAA